MIKQEYITLKPTETSILESAAAIFAAKVGQGKVDGNNEDAVISDSVSQAIKLAKEVEKTVKTKGEIG